MRLFVGGVVQVEETHEMSHRRKTLSMSALHLRLAGHLQVEEAFADSHRRKAVRMRHLPREIHSEQLFEGSSIDSHGRQTGVPMRFVSHDLRKEDRLEIARAKVAHVG